VGGVLDALGNRDGFYAMLILFIVFRALAPALLPALMVVVALGSHADSLARAAYTLSRLDGTDEVIASLGKRRTGITAGIFGWPTLRRMLIAANPDLPPEMVDEKLKMLRARIPGLDRQLEKNMLRATSRKELVEAFQAAGCPGLATDRNAFKTFCHQIALARKNNAPAPFQHAGACSSTNQPEDR